MADLHPCHDPTCQRQPNKTEEMGEKKSFNCVKYVFFTFNVLIWLLGCMIVSLGVWLHLNLGTQTTIVAPHSFLNASVVCIIAGVVIYVIGYMGLFGSFYENQCMLVGYFILGMLVFTLEIAAGVLAFMHKDDLRSMIEKDLSSSIRWHYQAAPSGAEESSRQPTYQSGDYVEWWLVMDSLQTELECCGVHNHTDWYYISAWPAERRVPDSCCKQPQPGCGQLEPRFWFERGCMAEMDYWFVKNMYIMGVLGITIAVLQILGMVASLVLFSYIRNHKFFV